ncbi:MAG TPA: phosphatase [Acidimicrobiales bacterium]|nr:phosphatase [Acidimicrobiales bacterium]
MWTRPVTTGGRHGALLDHLVESRLAGNVATSVENSLGNCRHLVEGHPEYTFGLSDWRDADFTEAVAAVEAAGGRPHGWGATDGGAAIDPEAAVAAIERHREALAPFLTGSRGRVLLATGHPFALLAHYAALSRALGDAGNRVLRPLEGDRDRVRTPDGRRASLRYLDGVACLYQDAALKHTHRPDPMEAMLEAVGGPDGVDLVVADHGYAGAAVERGIPTLSIADVNDPALPLAQARGKTDGVLVIDDGLDASLFRPVTAAILDRPA